MAVGLGMMLNFNLPMNFNTPYKACSIIDFWRRWHMTLSTFLKNYLYIPLGGNRNRHHIINIMITMILGGLWHGAGWTFVFWGTMHGILISINHLWRKVPYSLPKILAWLLTFNSVNFMWIFFRSESFVQAINIIEKMFDVNSVAIPYSGMLGKLNTAFLSNEMLLTCHDLNVIILIMLISLVNIDIDFVKKINETTLAIGLSIVFLYCFDKLGNISEFLYFKF